MDGISFLIKCGVVESIKNIGVDYYGPHLGSHFSEHAKCTTWPDGSMTVLPWVADGNGVNFVSHTELV